MRFDSGKHVMDICHQELRDPMEGLEGSQGRCVLEIPKVTKALPLIKWTEAFQDFLHCTIGVCIIPLAYVIQANVNVQLIPPPLVTNQPHSEENGSVENKRITWASHGHARFCEDNSQVYYHLEEATRGTSYVASIKPFQLCKDG